MPLTVGNTIRKKQKAMKTAVCLGTCLPGISEHSGVLLQQVMLYHETQTQRRTLTSQHQETCKPKSERGEAAELPLNCHFSSAHRPTQPPPWPIKFI